MEGATKNNDKLVIFDWGGIILNNTNSGRSFLDSIAIAIMKFNPQLTKETALLARKNTLFDENHICIADQNSEEEIIAWFNRLKKEANLEVDYDTFIQTYLEEFRKTEYYQEVIDYLYSLRSKVKIGILSDLLLIEWIILKEQVNFDLLDYAWLSYEQRTSKLQDEIFERIPNQTQIMNHNNLLVDDSADNIERAQKHGWKTCHALWTELEKIQESIHSFLDQ